MKRTVALAAVLAATLGTVLWLRVLPSPTATSAASDAAEPNPRVAPVRKIAAPGLVEAASEEISVGAEVAGRLTELSVEEGWHVALDQVIAKVDDTTIRVRIDAAQAEVQQRQAELTAVLNGANQLQRREAWVGIKEAEAVVQQARAKLDRREKLFEQGAVSREQVELADRDLNIAAQRAEAATIRRDMAGARPLDTDRQRAEAALRAARAHLKDARLMLAKTVVRAPIAGVVLHKYQHAGELVSQTSDPIVTLADLSKLRVRMEVDEADVGLVRLNQKAYVTALAYGDRKFPGHVIRIANVLGRKKVRTGDPAERVDTKVLETLIELEPAAPFPLGLRVTAYVLVDR